MVMPLQKPGYSKQDYGTPPELLAAVRQILSIKQFCIDLAASEANAVCPLYYSKENSAFEHEWDHVVGWAWCNPEFGEITPWVQKASESRGSIAMLVPASVGSNWWRDYVHEQAYVLFLNGRIRFVGAIDQYPKDCAILLYNPPLRWRGYYQVWTWR